jgi:hypothetical protein
LLPLRSIPTEVADWDDERRRLIGGGEEAADSGEERRRGLGTRSAKRRIGCLGFHHALRRKVTQTGAFAWH